MLFIFQGAFTVGFQACVWVYPYVLLLFSLILSLPRYPDRSPRCELLPLRLRQRGSSLSTASNWIMNYMVVQITPPAIANIGYRTYIIFAVLNAAWVPVIYVFFPETKGLELEDVDKLFRKGDFPHEGETGGIEGFDEKGTAREHVEIVSSAE